MKKETKPMTELGALNHWPEMFQKGWEDAPLQYSLTDKGQQELIRWHQNKRAWKFIAICLVFIILGVIYIFIR